MSSKETVQNSWK